MVVLSVYVGCVMFSPDAFASGEWIDENNPRIAKASNTPVLWTQRVRKNQLSKTSAPK